MGVQSKHFLNDPASLVVQSLQGLCAINPKLGLDTTNKVVFLADQEKSTVALVCGGGSGHEPSHAGFVGSGMLTAAVCGNVFASPGPTQVRRAIQLVDNDKGTLIIVKNYTGDVLNFGLAKEQFAAQHPSEADKVKFLVVGDDVAVGRTQGNIVGRRGLAGTVLVYKIAGALAQTGASLEEVYSVAEWVSKNIATVGVGLEHCHVPGTTAGETHLGASEIEIGMGIHNESGAQRVSPVPPLNELVQTLLDLLLSQNDPERGFLPTQGSGKDNVVLLVNNLGGVSELELAGIAREVVTALVGRGVSVQRLISGTFMTSLNMPGFSLTLLLLPSASDVTPPSDLILRLLDASTSAPGWKWTSGAAPSAPSAPPAVLPSERAADQGQRVRAQDVRGFERSVERACDALDKAEPEITKMDTVSGDGDCGLTLQTGANAVLALLRAGSISGEDVVGALIAVSEVASEKMGGTSGALYSIFFSALAQALSSSGAGEATAEDWSRAVSAAREQLYTYTRARPPSRTLVDPLAAFADAFSAGPSDLGNAVRRAAEAAEATRDAEARVGRSAYLEGGLLKRERVPDPGAWGVKVLLEALAGADSV
ncbi:dihydroxyacetone kinase 1 [Lactarius akahatsu]|uniref:Dihydroxyacetone kinase 1 n=1 Tax=Lactarius akahatsu TaxID=416441 RepID=A0AAD4LQV4_9AGAM|nr:dihydroxyacetone kinase 1 [Lactarius akahatsu]